MEGNSECVMEGESGEQVGGESSYYRIVTCILL